MTVIPWVRNTPQQRALKAILDKRATREGMVASATTYLGNFKNLAEDVAHDACVIALQCPDKIPVEDENRAVPFLGGISRMHGKATRRKRARERRFVGPLPTAVLSEDGERTSIIPGDDRPGGLGVDVDDVVERYPVWDYLARQHPRFEWLFLVRVVGETRAEIALRLGIPDSTVRGEVRRAILDLREQAEGYENLMKERAAERMKQGGRASLFVLFALLGWRGYEARKYYRDSDAVARFFGVGSAQRPDVTVPVGPVHPSYADELRVAAQHACDNRAWRDCVILAHRAVSEDPREGKVLAPLRELAIRSLRASTPGGVLDPNLERDLPPQSMFTAPPPSLDSPDHSPDGGVQGVVSPPR